MSVQDNRVLEVCAASALADLSESGSLNTTKKRTSPPDEMIAFSSITAKVVGTRKSGSIAANPTTPSSMSYWLDGQNGRLRTFPPEENSKNFESTILLPLQERTGIQRYHLCGEDNYAAGPYYRPSSVNNDSESMIYEKSGINHMTSKWYFAPSGDDDNSIKRRRSSYRTTNGNDLAQPTLNLSQRYKNKKLATSDVILALTQDPISDNRPSFLSKIEQGAPFVDHHEDIYTGTAGAQCHATTETAARGYVIAGGESNCCCCLYKNSSCNLQEHNLPSGGTTPHSSSSTIEEWLNLLIPNKNTNNSSTASVRLMPSFPGDDYFTNTTSSSSIISSSTTNVSTGAIKTTNRKIDVYKSTGTSQGFTSTSTDIKCNNNQQEKVPHEQRPLQSFMPHLTYAYFEHCRRKHDKIIAQAVRDLVVRNRAFLLLQQQHRLRQEHQQQLVHWWHHRKQEQVDQQQGEKLL